MSGERKGLVWVPVSEELLRQALHAPDNVRIVGCERDHDNGTIRLLMESFDFSPDAYPIPEVTPTIYHQREEWRWEWPAASGVPEGEKQ